MYLLRCCFVGEQHRPAQPVERIDLPFASASAEGEALAHDERSAAKASYEEAVTCSSASGLLGISKRARELSRAGAYIDAFTPTETPHLQPAPRCSDFGSRPELALAIRATRQGSSQLPDLDSSASLGHSDGVALCVAAQQHSPAAGRADSTENGTSFSAMVASVANACWIGQGAQGAVVQAQWRSGCTVAVKWLVTDAVDVPAAYLEALLCKMLAHPYLVQTFDYGLTQLDKSFEALCSTRGSCCLGSVVGTSSLAPSPLGTAMGMSSRIAPDLAASSSAQFSEEHFSVAATPDSFEGPQAAERVGPRPVDCVDVLKQLGAAPGKFVVQIVSEWCDEGTLHAAIRKGVFRAQPQSRRSKTWALRALLRTAREVALGMCHLHSLNIIHGDLKPGNVLLKSSRVDSRGFVAKVADFGLSRMLCNQHDEFVSTAEWATVPYMAGEYLDNKLCKSSDVYSFGVLMWQMFTGKAPFAGHHEAQVAVGVMMGNLQLEWPASMLPPLARLGQACCRHEPEQRPTFKECVVALSGIEAQVRDMAANAKARYAMTTLALQRGGGGSSVGNSLDSMLGPSAMPACSSASMVHSGLQGPHPHPHPPLRSCSLAGSHEAPLLMSTSHNIRNLAASAVRCTLEGHSASAELVTDSVRGVAATASGPTGDGSQSAAACVGSSISALPSGGPLAGIPYYSNTSSAAPHAPAPCFNFQRATVNYEAPSLPGPDPSFSQGSSLTGSESCCRRAHAVPYAERYQQSLADSAAARHIPTPQMPTPQIGAPGLALASSTSATSLFGASLIQQQAQRTLEGAPAPAAAWTPTPNLRLYSSAGPSLERGSSLPAMHAANTNSAAAALLSHAAATAAAGPWGGVNLSAMCRAGSSGSLAGTPQAAFLGTSLSERLCSHRAVPQSPRQLCAVPEVNSGNQGYAGPSPPAISFSPSRYTASVIAGYVAAPAAQMPSPVASDYSGGACSSSGRSNSHRCLLDATGSCFGHRMLPGYNTPAAWSQVRKLPAPPAFAVGAGGSLVMMSMSSGRRGSAGPVLQHVPEDDGDAGSSLISP